MDITMVSVLLSRVRACLDAARSTSVYYSVSRLLPYLIRPVSTLVRVAPVEDWKIQRVYPSLGDMQIVEIAPRSLSVGAILYLPSSNLAESSFERHKMICSGLKRNDQLGSWRELLPNIIYEGRLGDRRFWVGEKLPGMVATQCFSSVEESQAVILNAVESLGFLTRIYSGVITASELQFAAWIAKPVRRISKATIAICGNRSHEKLMELKIQLKRSITERKLNISWCHGDYWPGNILVSPDSYRITGIVDWDQSQPFGLPSTDIVSLLISSRSLLEGKELGEVLMDVLHRGFRVGFERDVWSAYSASVGGYHLPLWESLLIYWLQHLSAGLTKSRRYAVNPIWIYYNFVRVLRAL